MRSAVKNHDSKDQALVITGGICFFESSLTYWNSK